MSDRIVMKGGGSMSKTGNRLTILITSIILIIGITVTAFSVGNGKNPSVQAGEYQNLIADRIEITVKNTDFRIKKTTDSAETYTLTLTLSAKKTQPDFYAVINDLTISGVAYDNVVFTALTRAAENKTLKNLTLTSTNGEADLFSWQIDATMTFSGKGVYNATLNIDFTSGITRDTAVQKLTEIPITITVE